MTEPGSLGRAIAARMAGLTLEKVASHGLANARANQPSIAAGQSVLALRALELGEGDAALVVAAGPSLHRLDAARQLRDSGFRGAIVATDSGMGWCLRNGIVPHLVVTVDPHPERIVRWFGDPQLTAERLQADDYFLRQDMDPRLREPARANEELMQLLARHGPALKVAVSSSAAATVVQRVADTGMQAYWWNPVYDDWDAPDSLTRRLRAENGLPCLNAGGNVGTACWVIAHAILGKRRVGLLGVDFGYYPDTPYTRTQYYKEVLALVGPERLDEVFVRVPNPHTGGEFYTDPAYLWYRDCFLEMAAHASCETWNCTGGGILFGPGVRWASLAEFFHACGE